uniref:Uncharacterized protein n=1 Tax=Mycobacterium riyadhense TaxID=486698 RepID=A0A653EV57_9MYCO|nr:hypothetical protein BIN_B_03961 [Mycobacterium riyadhense]
MTATGSSTCAGEGAAARSSQPDNSPSKYLANPATEPWSHATVSGSSRPVTAANRLRSSTVIWESKPISEKALSRFIARGSGWPSIFAVSALTTSTSNR